MTTLLNLTRHIENTHFKIVHIKGTIQLTIGISAPNSEIEDCCFFITEKQLEELRELIADTTKHEYQ